ncbi:TetR/AcrR family transcriptional regulator [Kiloniella laminariae]|uniref:TetR/AcrR family transcriptional regulator n=1 Tax=Kiloniella laminariae TaxID=454162 RepID=A0ABT4LPM9_9PROT|nr:TetR/AcrR family transcriptional regulator [Kiloniella laminariae]MCZ4283068.1 TetR/AcrR family transcriptional regulator [Kiloniella laminariae]
MANGKRQRLDPDDRKQLLLQSARDSLARYGAQGTGVREICKEIGVSPGLLTHYFNGKDSLFIEAYIDMAQSYNAEILKITENPNFSAEQRMKNLFDLYFSSDWVDEATTGTYIGFWSLSRTIPELRDAFNKTFKIQHHAIETLVSDLVEERQVDIDPKPFAAFLLVCLEGTWFQLCFNPEVVEKESIQALCWDWLEIYLLHKSKS